MFKKLVPEAIIPQYQTKYSSGMDLHSIDYCNLRPGQRALIGTGLAIEDCPLDPTDEITRVEFQIRARSGLAYKNGIMLVNGIGTIDWDYKGELKVLLYNSSDKLFNIEPGDRVAQLVICPIIQLQEFVAEKERGEGGFGST